jgi:uncharacterized membrane protein YbhN (UPF0104 family)
VLAGVPGASAIVATLAFRLVTYWLPTMGGGVSYFLFRRRYGPIQSSASRPLPGSFESPA